MRVLVTGGACFIGSHVVAELIGRGHDPVVFDMTEDGQDVRDPAAVRNALAGVDAVCHQAAKVGLGKDFGDAPGYVSVNDLGTAVLLAEMAEAGVRRLLLAGSMVVYGEGRYECAAHGVAKTSECEILDLVADGQPQDNELAQARAMEGRRAASVAVVMGSLVARALSTASSTHCTAAACKGRSDPTAFAESPRPSGCGRCALPAKQATHRATGAPVIRSRAPWRISSSSHSAGVRPTIFGWSKRRPALQAGARHDVHTSTSPPSHTGSPASAADRRDARYAAFVLP
ncbi:NAD-dependent epimerase/dehydratase family protein [Streptomyces hydrogenans]|uniref:NAD-dependent epimerase/dehydratase domain-containing protein n=1 Tax=Streptomyces hydrogenans TaxID=1873719 RepID=A0ABQ3PSZ8_9ACTN|nr:NAD(P)-dependent oxidoreductase [Streptomyces hydrogenans]GHF97857.1 hypothetical protein GCM10018784_06670 [Streptomyces hydrogenans]GHI28154.1 hypothetical protein Shyd_95250 [Streptomyces hydrogenans]